MSGKEKEALTSVTTLLIYVCHILLTCRMKDVLIGSRYWTSHICITIYAVEHKRERIPNASWQTDQF